METSTSQNIFIKTIKTPDVDEPRIISVSPAPHIQKVEELTVTERTVVETISVNSTIHTSDSVGNTVTESTNPIFISTHIPIQSTITNITSSYSEYSTYEVKYTKTVEYGKTTEVILTLEGPSPVDTPIQVVAFYDQTTKTVRIVDVHEIHEVAIIAAPYPVPNISVITIPEG